MTHGKRALGFYLYVGANEGFAVGDTDGRDVGLTVGLFVGMGVGREIGTGDGTTDGAGVGTGDGTFPRHWGDNDTCALATPPRLLSTEHDVSDVQQPVLAWEP